MSPAASWGFPEEEQVPLKHMAVVKSNCSKANALSDCRTGYK